MAWFPIIVPKHRKHPDDTEIHLTMDGEPVGTLADLIAANNAPGVDSPDPDYWEPLRELAVGQSCEIWNGCHGTFRFTRTG